MESLSNSTVKGNLQKYGVKNGCDYCAYKATTKSRLQQHVTSVHDGQELNIVVSYVNIRQVGKVTLNNM